MSLICVRCGKIIVLSTNPDHFGACGACGAGQLTEEEKKQIKHSSEYFNKIQKEK